MESEYVTNPTTGRPIKVGGRVWKSLKRHGLVESTYNTDDAESAEYTRPDKTKETLEDVIDRMLAGEEEQEEEDEGDVSYY